jgi:glutathione synthase/RimK-type ligase-like ATP-grasp enzyme
MSLERKGIKVFPDTNTCWHFDDKIGQKYLFEAIQAPFVKSYIFYSRQDAFDWIKKTTFPKVFKLRGGAGSINVRLVKTQKNAKRLVNKSFRKGFRSTNYVSLLKDRFWVLKRDKNTAAVIGIIKGLARLIFPHKTQRFFHKQNGYIYFQDFIPDNYYDTRLVVIGDRCFGIRRYCRQNDFRASGSGILAYDPELFDINCIQSAFEIAKKVKSQSIAMDFVLDRKQSKIVEMSYCFIMGKSYDDCQGFWDSNLIWHNKEVNPQYFIIEDFIKSLTNES